MSAKNKATEQVAESKFDHYKRIGKDKLIADHKNLSGAIRFLNAEGLTRGEIAKIVERKYQHVRNVLVTPVGQSATQTEK